MMKKNYLDFCYQSFIILFNLGALYSYNFILYHRRDVTLIVKTCRFLNLKPEIIMNLLIKTDKINF